MRSGVACQPDDRRTSGGLPRCQETEPPSARGPVGRDSNVLSALAGRHWRAGQTDTRPWGPCLLLAPRTVPTAPTAQRPGMDGPGEVPRYMWMFCKILLSVCVLRFPPAPASTNSYLRCTHTWDGSPPGFRVSVAQSTSLRVSCDATSLADGALWPGARVPHQSLPNEAVQLPSSTFSYASIMAGVYGGLWGSMVLGPRSGMS